MLDAIRSLLTRCRHDGPSTLLRTLGGAEVWRCELCGGHILVADDVGAYWC